MLILSGFSKLKISGLRRKQAIWGHHVELWETLINIFHYSQTFHRPTNKIVEKINNILIKNENNCCLQSVVLPLSWPQQHKTTELQQLLTYSRWHRCSNFEILKKNTDFSSSRIVLSHHNLNFIMSIDSKSLIKWHHFTFFSEQIHSLTTKRIKLSFFMISASSFWHNTVWRGCFFMIHRLRGK